MFGMEMYWVFMNKNKWIGMNGISIHVMLGVKTDGVCFFFAQISQWIFEFEGKLSVSLVL